MRIVTRVTRQVQVSAGDVRDLGCHVVWCPTYRPVAAGRVAGRCEELIRAKASEHGRPVVALEIMPDHVPLFVKAHPCGSPSRVASQFIGFTSRRLRAEPPHPRSRLSALWSRSYFAAAAGAVPAQTVRRRSGMQNGRPWRKERAR
jgi:putative transposase